MFNDLSREIADAIDDGSSYYTLSYTPTDTNWDGTFRNWVRRETDFNPNRPNDSSSPYRPVAKQLAREANYDRALAGAAAAARGRAVG